MKKIIEEFKPAIKYGVVGIVGTAIDVGCLFVLIEYLGVSLLPAASLSFLVAVVNNFVWNKVWTFRNKSTNYKKLFIKFFIVSCGGLILTNISMYFWVVMVTFWYVHAKLLTSVLVLTWNFLANKYWTFSLKHHEVLGDEHFVYDYSIVIPAYNEENRIQNTVEEVIRYCADQNLNAEVLVSDDGSADLTVAKVQAMAKKSEFLKVLKSQKNMGKGFAVRQGVMAARGEWILFTDADNSTPIHELKALTDAAKAHGADIAIGSRYLKNSRVKIQQSALRIAIGRLGNFLIRAFVIDGIQDTQCGFKMFQNHAARDIFSCNKINRWGFDMEVLAIARLRQYKIIEVPVSWYNSPDSRLRPIRDAINTFVELVRIKLNLWCGRYDEG